MIRNLSDTLTYRHDSGQNELTFSVHWGGA